MYVLNLSKIASLTCGYSRYSCLQATGTDSERLMHPWFLCRKYRLFCIWLGGSEKTTNARLQWRYLVMLLVYVIFPVLLMFVYDWSGLWNPFIGVDESGDPEKLITRLMGPSYWIALWFIHKAAVTPWCMPKPLKQLCLAFREAEEKYDTSRYFMFDGVRTLFQNDLLKRTDIYLSAGKKASAEEVALSALSDIALEQELSDLHKKVTVRLEEIDAARPRLERILAFR